MIGEVTRANFPFFCCDRLGVSLPFGVWFLSLAICANWLNRELSILRTS
jgi:hypothetical protein